MTALAGIRVIELANERINYAGKLLADMGADVILVEPPNGDPSRSYPPFLDNKQGPNRSLYWWHYHTNKRGVVIDLDDNNGLQQLKSLINTADILLEAEPRTRLETLGADYKDLVKTNTGLIHIAVTTYGRKNPKSDLPATDLTIMAASGPPWSCGYDDHSLPPIRGPQQAYHTASHFAVMSGLTALLHRGIGDRGQFVDVSMTAASNISTEAATYSWLVNQGTVQRQTGRHASVQLSGETQQLCADGRYANTGVPPRFPHEFKNLYDWLIELKLDSELPEAIFLEMGANWEGPFELSKIGEDDEITAIFSAGRAALQLIASKVAAQDFFTGCQRAGLSVGVVNSPEEAFEDEHFKTRGYQVPVLHDDIDREIIYPGAPYAFGKSKWSITRRAPHLGEHNKEILDSH